MSTASRIAHSEAPPRLFHRLFIANRGEVAVRIARACDSLGITPVFAVSAADRGAADIDLAALLDAGHRVQIEPLQVGAVDFAVTGTYRPRFP